MPRTKLELPSAFSFSTKIPVRITDVNYGGHVGNDTILSLLHEARMQFLKNSGYSELDIGGVGLIMSDVVIEFKSELFYGDEIIASVTVGEFSRAGFEIFYKLEKKLTDKTILIVAAKTDMVFYDYPNKKIVSVPENIKTKLIAG